MIAADLPPLLLPAKPAIIRPATPDLLRPDPRAGIFGVYGPIISRRVAPPSFSLVGIHSGTGDTATINGGTATGRQVGDFCLLFHSLLAGTGTTSLGVFTDFTSIRSDMVGDAAAVISRKILTGSETTVTGGINHTAGTQRWIVVVLRPSTAITSVTTEGGAVHLAGSEPAPQTISMAGEVPPVIGLGIMHGSAAGYTRTAVGMAEIDGAAAGLQFAHYKVCNPGEAPANITYDMSDSGTINGLQTAWVTIV